MDVTEAIRDHAREKVEKLPKFYSGLHSVAVTLDKDAGAYLAEIVATGARKAVFVACHSGDDLSVCLDQCVHKLTEQLRRHKDRVRDRHGPGHDRTMAAQPPPQERPGPASQDE